jgi:hypothetical protein
MVCLLRWYRRETHWRSRTAERHGGCPGRSDRGRADRQSGVVGPDSGPTTGGTLVVRAPPGIGMERVVTAAAAVRGAYRVRSDATTM